MIWKEPPILRQTLAGKQPACLRLIVSCLTLTSSLLASPNNIYFIGNSFTWDTQPHNLSTATIYPNGLDPDIAWSIFSGKSLTYIVDNPEDTVSKAGWVAADYYPDPHYSGNYEADLLARSWEAISMQPHTYGGGLFLDTEISAANTIIAKARENPGNQNSVFYIVGPWAFQEGPDKNNGRSYSQNWLSGYSQNQIDNALLPNVRQAFRALFWDQLKTDNPNVVIKWIPVGEMVYRIDQELQNGAIDGLTGAWDLFDQYGVHLHDTDDKGIAGRYISHITTLCTIWGSEPSAFQTKYDELIDADFKSLVDQAVWSTLLEFYPDIETWSLPEQFIQFPVIPDASILDKSAQMLATSSSNLPVIYELVSGPALIEGESIQFLSHGEVTIRAIQTGNENWGPAPPVIHSFDVYSIADTWRLQKLGTYKNAGIAADLEDPDFDNIPNLFEYFLGTSPLNYDLSNVLTPINEDSRISYQTTQSSGSLNGLSILFEMSQNLVDWVELDSDLVEIIENNEGDLNYRIQPTDLPKPYFIRLNISAL